MQAEEVDMVSFMGLSLICVGESASAEKQAFLLATHGCLLNFLHSEPSLSILLSPYSILKK